MATIKSYTDIEQSKKLAKILPFESADMYYPWYIEEDRDNIKSGHRISIPSVGNFIHKVNILPCWSLADLLSVLPKNLNIGRPSLESNYKGYYWIQYYDEFMKPSNYKTKCFDNPVDACYELILKLHELKML